MGMTILSGNETSAEIINIAYGMENGLGEFYSTVAKRTDNPELAALLMQLAKVEEKHKNRLFDLYLSIDPVVSDREKFESGIASELMEGGFTAEDFWEKNGAAMQTVAGVLNVAMMLEAQALDLYLRYSRKAKEEKSKSILYGIAEEEKAHLTALGNLMEEYSSG